MLKEYHCYNCRYDYRCRVKIIITWIIIYKLSIKYKYKNNIKTDNFAEDRKTTKRKIILFKINERQKMIESECIKGY